MKKHFTKYLLLFSTVSLLSAGGSYLQIARTNCTPEYYTTRQMPVSNKSYQPSAIQEFLNIQSAANKPVIQNIQSAANKPVIQSMGLYNTETYAMTSKYPTVKTPSNQWYQNNRTFSQVQSDYMIHESSQLKPYKNAMYTTSIMITTPLMARYQTTQTTLPVSELQEPFSNRRNGPGSGTTDPDPGGEPVIQPVGNELGILLGLAMAYIINIRRKKKNAPNQIS